MGRQKYRVLRADRQAPTGTFVVGDTVYDIRGHDYGVAGDDSRMTGIEHVSVTKDSSGGYPSFTIPKEDLEAIAE